SAGGADIFVAKYRAGGTVEWARRAGGTSDDKGQGIAVDRNGNVFVVGNFNGNVDFSGTTLTGAGSDDVFLTKFASDGTVIWAKGSGGINKDYATAVALDATGNVYMTGETLSDISYFGGITLTNK